MDKHREAYKEEANELLSELEAALLELEENPNDKELVARVFRAMHTIKGSGAMFGFDNIAEFTHEIETVFDRVRGGDISVTKDLADLTLSACDQIRKMVEGVATDQSKVDEIVSAFKEMLPDTEVFIEELPPSSSEEPPETDTGCQADITYRIRFRPNHDIFTTGTNLILLLDELRGLGQCQVMAQVGSIPPLQDLDPEACYLYWDVILTTKAGVNSIKDVFIFIEDECELTIDVIDEEGDTEEEMDYRKLGEILVERGDVNVEDLKKALQSQKRIGEVLLEAKVVDGSTLDSALAEQQLIRQQRQTRQEKILTSSVRVAADKLDILVGLVGELVTVQASLSQKAAIQEDEELLSISEEVERLTAELRDNTMSIRMMPISTTFSKFKRLIRDLSSELRKNVALTTEGGETELDKTVIERLNNPLIHIIRNCIDHGIEMPDIREATGKPRQGTVHLSAVHSGAHVLIRISDDGTGLDPEAIYKKAVESGLISADAELAESEIFSLIFTPGFSMAKKVTDVSGRGVGMDVVKRGIEALRGSIELDSKTGSGTTVTLKLPLTLAIIDGLLVEIGGSYFVLPLSSVEECVELTKKDISRAHGRHITSVRGETVPYIRLRELFMSNGNAPDIEQIVITEVDGRRVGFVVDHVKGEHQTVIKSLGKIYKNVEGVSGATILGDGTVALIVDLPKLTQLGEVEEKNQSAGFRLRI